MSEFTLYLFALVDWLVGMSEYRPCLRALVSSCLQALLSSLVGQNVDSVFFIRLFSTFWHTNESWKKGNGSIENLKRDLQRDTYAPCMYSKRDASKPPIHSVSDMKRDLWKWHIHFFFRHARRYQRVLQDWQCREGRSENWPIKRHIPSVPTKEPYKEKYSFYSYEMRPTIYKTPPFILGIHEMRETCAFTLIERTPPPRGGFLFTMFPDQEPCVRDFTTRCDGRISSWNLLHTALDQGTW